MSLSERRISSRIPGQLLEITVVSIKCRTELSIVTNRPHRDSRPLENRQPKRSFGGSFKCCLQPRYRLVVRTEGGLKRNWICPSSPPVTWQSFAQVRLRSCRARWKSSRRREQLRTTHQGTFSEISAFQGCSVTPHCPEHSSRRDRCSCQPPVNSKLHPDRMGTVWTLLSLPTRSTMAQCPCQI